MLTGESEVDELFLDVVRDALNDVLPEAVALPFTEISVTRIVNPLSATARGPAKLAKCKPESPDDAVETVICGGGEGRLANKVDNCGWALQGNQHQVLARSDHSG